MVRQNTGFVVDKPRPNPKAIGEISEIMAISFFVKAGKKVFTPFGDNQRCDLIVEDDNGDFLKIQVKTGRVRNGAITFPCCSSYAHRKLKSKNYRGQIDFFAVYVPSLNQLYVLPVDEVGINKGNLRLTPPKNNQKQNVRWAKDFEFSGSFEALGDKKNLGLVPSMELQ